MPQPPAGDFPAPQAAPVSTADQLGLRLVVRELLLRRYDADGNGKLDPDEHRRMTREAREALHEETAAVAADFDSDSDGRLSPEEMKAMRRHHVRRDGAAPMPPPDADRRSAGRGSDERRGAERKDAVPPPQGDRPDARPEKRSGKRPENADSRRAPRSGKAGEDTERGKRGRGPRRTHAAMGGQARAIAYMTHRLLLDAYDADADGRLDEEEVARCRARGAELYAARSAELIKQYDTDGDGSVSIEEYEAAERALLEQVQQRRRNTERPQAPAPEAEEDGRPAPPPTERRRMLPPDVRDTLDILHNLSPCDGSTR